jgi:hypothetical protein
MLDATTANAIDTTTPGVVAAKRRSHAAHARASSLRAETMTVTDPPRDDRNGECAVFCIEIVNLGALRASPG